MILPTNIIALSAPVSIEAGSANRVPTFEAVIYTGGALTVGNWDLPVVIDLGGLGRGNVLVANLDHDARQRVGNFDVENDGGKLTAWLRISSDGGARRSSKQARRRVTSGRHLSKFADEG